MSLPDGEGALEILRESGCCSGVVTHCVNVTGVAMRLAGRLVERGLEVDVALVEVGALLHDLGRARTHSVRHGVVGGEMARELGLPGSVVRIIERHIGAGIPRGEAAELRLPEGDYVPETLEEKVVAYADKLIEGHREVGIEVTIRKLEAELGAGHPGVGRLRALHEEMSALLGL